MRFASGSGIAAVILVARRLGRRRLVLVHPTTATTSTQIQRDEAMRAAHQMEAVAGLSVGQLASAAAFFQAEGDFTRHEFDVDRGARC